MRSVPRRLRVPGALPAMAAFWTRRVCAPWRRGIFQTEAGDAVPGSQLICKITPGPLPCPSPSRISGRIMAIEPAQRLGRAIAGPGPSGVARLLFGAVVHVEAELIGTRHLLQPGNARQAQPLVALERSGRIVRPLPQTGAERGAVLYRLCRALSHEGVHRVAGIAEQRRAAYRPSRQRVAVEQGPDETGLGAGDDAANLWVPALEGGERAGDGGVVGPVLAIPGVVLGPADEIQQAPARHEIVHEMATGTEPGLVAALQAEIGDPLDRHQPTISDTAGELRRLFAE